MEIADQKKRICIVTTLWSSIENWIIPFLDEYNRRGIDVTVCCNMDEQYEKSLKERFPFVHTKPMPFPRGINVTGSLRSIRLLELFFKEERFDLVQYSTPNASMYASIAAKRAKIPVRLYCQWGMVYVTMTGVKRKIFEGIERMVCRNSTEIQPDSYGNLEFCRKNGLYDERKSTVIWNGSAKGLDLSDYDIEKKQEYRKEIRAQYDIPEDAPVVGFVGRLGREKGCNELFKAFKEIQKGFPGVKLLFVGPIEKEETIEPDLLSYFRECRDIIKTGRVSHVEKYTAAMDVFALPSYREGFGMSVVEASAMEVPVVTTKYPGPSGGMVDGRTGYAVEVKAVEELRDRLTELLHDRELAERMGIEGRRFVEESFDRRWFMEKYMENREKLLGLKVEE